MADKIFDSTVGSLNTALNLRLLNQNVISSNIANADTPGYKSQSLEFENALRDALGVGDDLSIQVAHPDHIVPRDTDPIHPYVHRTADETGSLDGNTVNRAQEMAKMAENQILYDAAVEMLKRKLGMLEYAISEGGGNR